MFAFEVCAEKRIISVEDAFIESLTLRENSRLKESELIFDAIIQAQSNPIILTELAKIYYKEGKFAKAALVLKLVRKGFKLDKETIEKLDRDLEYIRTRQGVFSYNVTGVYTKNPRRNPNSGIYKIFGIPLSYENEEEKSFLGLNHTLSFKKKLTNGFEFFSAAKVSDFEMGNLDSHSISASLTKQITNYNLFPQISVNYQKAPNYTQYSTGARLRYEKAFSYASMIPSIGLYRTDNSMNGLGRGHKADLSFLLQRKIKKNIFRLNLKNQDEQVSLGSNSNISQSLNFNGDILTNFIKFKPFIGISKISFKDEDPLWEQKRNDNFFNIGLVICPKKNLLKPKATVCLGWNREKRTSNIEFFSYQEDTYIFELSNEF